MNNQPSSPTEGTVPKSLGYINTEVKFQLSAKMKMLEGLFKDHLDVWIGYTQLSFFQMYSQVDLVSIFGKPTTSPKSFSRSIPITMCLGSEDGS